MATESSMQEAVSTQSTNKAPTGAIEDAVWFDMPILDKLTSDPPSTLGSLIMWILLQRPTKSMSWEDVFRWIITNVACYWVIGYNESTKRAPRYVVRQWPDFNKQVELNIALHRYVVGYLFSCEIPVRTRFMTVHDHYVRPDREIGYTPDVGRAWHYLQLGCLCDDLRNGNNFPFMQLPAELRFMVYDHYFDHTKYIFVLSGRRPRLRTGPAGEGPKSPRFSLSTALALTRTCRIVHEEATPLFYKCNVIQIEKRLEAASFLKHTVPIYKIPITNLVLGFSPTTNGTGEMFKALRKLETLKRLTILEERYRGRAAVGQIVNLGTGHAIENALMKFPGIRELSKLRGLQNISLPSRHEFLEKWLKARVTQPKKEPNASKAVKKTNK